MHFLGGEDYCLGYFNNNDEDWAKDLAMIITHFFQSDADTGGDDLSPVTCIPSFVTCSAGDEWKAFFRDQFSEAAVFKDADWGHELYLLNKYGSKLFDRAGEEERQISRAAEGW